MRYSEPIVMLTMEIHNHFESGSSAQVFNDQVTNKLIKPKQWKKKSKYLSEQQMKQVKKQWRKQCKKKCKERR